METPALPKRTILAVDDDEMNLMILMKNAKDAGYDVKPFMEGSEAMAYLEEHPQEIDIAIVDKMMPDVSGIQLLEFIKRHESLKHMPVILQTGDAGVEQMREALEHGACYYLTKPFHPEMMSAVLNAAERICKMRDELRYYQHKAMQEKKAATF